MVSDSGEDAEQGLRGDLKAVVFVVLPLVVCFLGAVVSHWLLALNSVAGVALMIPSIARAVSELRQGLPAGNRPIVRSVLITSLGLSLALGLGFMGLFGLIGGSVDPISIGVSAVTFYFGAAWTVVVRIIEKHLPIF